MTTSSPQGFGKKDHMEQSREISLMEAVETSDVFQVATILARSPTEVNTQNKIGISPLHLAIFNQHKEIVEIMLASKKCDLSLRDRFGRTAVDFLKYTSDNELFNIVMRSAYPSLQSDYF